MTGKDHLNLEKGSSLKKLVSFFIIRHNIKSVVFYLVASLSIAIALPDKCFGQNVFRPCDRIEGYARCELDANNTQTPYLFSITGENRAITLRINNHYNVPGNLSITDRNDPTRVMSSPLTNELNWIVTPGDYILAVSAYDYDNTDAYGNDVVVSMIGDPISVPTPTISGNTTYSCGATLQLSASLISGATYSWTGPNGFTASGQTITVSNLNQSHQGTYTVIASTTCGNASASKSVIVNSVPTPTATAPASIFSGQTLQLSASLIPMASYEWTGPNGFYSTQQNPSILNISIAGSGTYTVRAKIGSCYSNGASKVVNVIQTNYGPCDRIEGYARCELDAYNTQTPYWFSITGGNRAITLQINNHYNVPGNLSITDRNDPTRVMSWPLTNELNWIVTPGDYILAVSAYNYDNTDAYGNDVVVSMIGVPIPVPTPTISGNTTYNCGTTLQLSASLITGATYSWTGPNGFTASGQTITVSNLNQSHQGTFTVIASTTCGNASASKSVTISPVPTPSITGNSSVCERGTLNLSAAISISGATYSWTGPNGFTSNIQNPSIANVTSANSGEYKVKAMIGSCSSSEASKLVTIISVNTPAISSNSPVCTGGTLNLAVAPVTGTSYSWSGPNGFTSNQSSFSIANISSAQAGTYQVKAIVGGCESTLVSTTVDVKPPVSLSPDIELRLPLNFTVYENIVGLTFQWRINNVPPLDANTDTKHTIIIQVAPQIADLTSGSLVPDWTNIKEFTFTPFVPGTNPLPIGIQARAIKDMVSQTDQDKSYFWRVGIQYKLPSNGVQPVTWTDLQIVTVKGNANSIPANYLTPGDINATSHTNEINWVYEVSYLDEGKVAQNIAYMDGLGSPRQNQSLLTQGIPVTWTAATGCSIQDNNITKTALTAAWDAGATSTQLLNDGGYVDSQVEEVNKYRSVGLSSANWGNIFSNIKYAFSMSSDGNLFIHESGISRGAFGAYLKGDILRISAERGQIKYYKNNALLYTSAVVPSFPMVVVGAFYHSGATLKNVYMSSKTQVLATETVYSEEGGSSVQSMVAPTGSSLFGYAVNFFDVNTGTTASPVYTDFTTANFDRVVKGTNFNSIMAPSPLESTRPGSVGYYYSNNNASEPYVDDAQGLAFSYSVAYDDPLGRPMLSGGVGDTYKITGGKETKSYTTGVSDTELQRVFGKEDADKLRNITVNITKDPNGVETFSYTDDEGKVIATALSACGVANQNMLIEDGMNGYISRFNILKNDVLNEDDLSKESSNSFYLSCGNTPVNLKYQIDQGVFGTGTNTCKNCEYNLKIRVVENSTGQVVLNTIKKIPSGSSQLACNATPVTFTYDETFTPVNSGTYTVYRTLEPYTATTTGGRDVVEEAIYKYTEALYSDLQTRQYEFEQEYYGREEWYMMRPLKTVETRVPGIAKCQTHFTGDYENVTSTDGNLQTASYGAGIAAFDYDIQGNIYVLNFIENGKHAVRKISTNGQVTTLLRTTSLPYTISNITADDLGNVYFTDNLANGKIRKISSTGVVTDLYSGKVSKGSIEFYNGLIYFTHVSDLNPGTHTNISVIDVNGNLIRNNFIIAPSELPYNSIQHGRESLLIRKFNNQEEIYYAGRSNNVIYKIDAAGNYTVYTGAVGIPADNDGVLSGARFNRPSGLAEDKYGNIYVSDYYSVRKIDVNTGRVSTLIGGNVNNITFITIDLLVDSKGDIYFNSINSVFKLSNCGIDTTCKEVLPQAQLTLINTPDNTSSPETGSVCNGNFVWEKTATGQGNQYVISSVSDNTGNTYITGNFNNSISFGSISLTSRGDLDIFIAKYDANGALLWAKQAGGTTYDAAGDIAVDKLGNVYIAASFSGITNFDGNTITSNGFDGYLAKYDLNGNFKWVKVIGGNGVDFNYEVAIDPIGNIITTGIFSSTISLNGTILNNLPGNIGLFVVKYDSQGNILNAIQAQANDIGQNDIEIDKLGNVYITGSFVGTANFSNNQITSNGGEDFYLVKYDNNLIGLSICFAKLCYLWVFT